MLLLGFKNSSFEGFYRAIFFSNSTINGYNNIHFMFYVAIIDIILSILSLQMNFTLLDDTDVSQAYAAYLRELRKQAKLSRAALAERSCVPAATIKKFELTGQISFRQLLLLWQTLDSLRRLYELTQPNKERAAMPSSIDEVLKDEF